MGEKSGKLYLVPTPVGNLGDITLRALEVLKVADYIACEDTRRTGRLLQHYELGRKRLVKFFEHNELAALKRISGYLEEGFTVALCSDGGMPAVSDPGYRLVNAAHEKNFSVEVLPGASAVLTALVSSGLPVASFTFRGFPPRKKAKLTNFLVAEKQSKHTQILFESPYRVGKLLLVCLEVYGERDACVCRELTKMHEEVRRGRLGDLADYYAKSKVKGEVTIVIAGADATLA